MIKKILLTLTLLTILCTYAPLLLGHGVNVSIEKKSPFILVKASYHGGNILSGARVTVSTITGSTGKTGFQTGDTDQNGNFCFYPVITGQWTVVVDDLAGHRGKKTITLTDDFFNPPPPPASLIKTAEPTPQKLPQPQPQPVKQEPASSPFSKNQRCCYLLKISLAILFILLITFITYRWRKRIETS